MGRLRFSLTVQDDDGIDDRGAPRWNVAGNRRDRKQQKADSQVHRRIERPYLEPIPEIGNRDERIDFTLVDRTVTLILRAASCKRIPPSPYTR
jgi:hypothetical protein